MEDPQSKLSLQIRHPSLDLSVVCKDLGLTPSYVWKAGDQRRTPKGTPLSGHRISSYCSVRLDDGTGKPLSKKIDLAIAALQPHRLVFDQLTSSGGKVSLFIGWFLTRDSGDGIEWLALRALSSLKISLDIKVYLGGLEDDAADDTDATKM